MKTYKKYRTAANILFPVVSLLTVVLLIGNTLAFSNYSLVSKFLNQPTDKKVNVSGEEIDSEYFKSDYKKLKQVQKDETVYAQDVQAEGSVLLQNKGFPLKEGAKVTLLGYGCTQANFLVGGGGSGTQNRCQERYFHRFHDILRNRAWALRSCSILWLT